MSQEDITQEELNKSGLVTIIALIDTSQGLDAAGTVLSDLLFPTPSSISLSYHSIIMEVFDGKLTEVPTKDHIDKEIVKNLNLLAKRYDVGGSPVISGIDIRQRFANGNYQKIVALMPRKEFEKAKHAPALEGALIIMRYADFKMSGPSVVRLTPKQKSAIEGDLEDAVEMEKRKAERRK
jgi:hypothetical protein